MAGTKKETTKKAEAKAADKKPAAKAEAKKAVAKSADKKPAAKPEDKKAVAKAADKKLAAKPEAKKTADKKPAAKPEAKKAEAKAATIAKKGALPRLFSVSAKKKVRFSMGNLQFNPKKYEFRFALHQYDRIGDDNTKIAPNYNGWIDLFGYGSSGYMGVEPTTTTGSQSTGDPYPHDDIANTKYDWGVYNPISNGGNKEGSWRTLTIDEWIYLFKTRPNAAKLKAYASVNGIEGVILLPDDYYEHHVRMSINFSWYFFSDNTFDLTQWATLEAAGAVFLPECFVRERISINYHIWSYWTSSASGGGSYYAQTVGLPGNLDGWGFRWHGYAVRLVQDAK